MKKHLTITIVFTIFIIVLGILIKNIPESDIQKQILETSKLPSITFFDKMDRWSEKVSDDLFYEVRLMSDLSLVIHSLLFSIIIFLIADLISNIQGKFTIFKKSE